MVTFTKNQVERYYFRSDNLWQWATFFVADDTGEISIQSDYGDYGYVWTRGGRGTESLKEFLADADFPYVMNKFSYGRDKWFDHDSTMAALKKEITRVRRTGTITDDQARSCWDELEELNDYTDKGMWCHATAESYNIMKYIFDGDVLAIPIRMDYEPQLVAFMENIWPEFIKVIKAELAAKGDTV